MKNQEYVQNEIQNLKNHLKMYHHYIEKREKYIQELKRIDELLSSVPTIRYPKPEGTGMFNVYELFDNQERFKREIEIWSYHINRVDNMFKKLDNEDVEILKKLYFEKRRYEDVCLEHYMSEMTLKRYVDRMLKEFC